MATFLWAPTAHPHLQAVVAQPLRIQVDLTLPVAVVVSFIPFRAMGITTNITSLGGVAIGMGELADAAIVVVCRGLIVCSRTNQCSFLGKPHAWLDNPSFHDHLPWRDTGA